MSSRQGLEGRIQKRLLELGGTLATAESCSGGLLAHRITNVPGSSEYYLGGVVTYSNRAKTSLLRVRKSDLAEWGAVSEPVARQMAEGVRRRFGADFGIGITGIAGPGGDTVEKPVGLVYIAIAGAAGTVVKRNRFAGTREAIKDLCADKALRMLLEYLG